MASPSSLSFFLILCLVGLKSSSSADTITATHLLKDPSSLTSSNGVFRLGFFTPQGSTNRYVGTWYSSVSQDIIWVANRNSPLTDSSGKLQISDDGNLHLLTGENRSIWSADSSAASTARLLNSGNFVLLGPDSRTIIWQSFDHPVDSFLPEMKLTFTKNPNSTSLIFLRSWKSNSDPSEGRFSVGFDTFPVPQLVIREEGSNLPRWRSGPWNGNMFIGIQDNINFGGVVSAGFILATDRRATMSLSFTYSDGSSASFLSNYAVNSQGTLFLQWWDDGKKSWEVSWKAPQSDCDGYGHCGAFASCNPQNSLTCHCLKGFEPKNKAEWSRRNWSNGCVRRTKLQCNGTGGNEDGFWTLKNVKVPDMADWVLGLSYDECRGQCLSNCSCLACMYDTGAGCLWWSRDLIDTVEIPDGRGLDLKVRLASSELQEGANGKVKIIAATAGVLGTIALAVFVYLLWRRMSRKQDEKSRPRIDLPEGRSEVELEELPVMKLEKLVIATNNFDISNKLGQGGFGPVYKGILDDGQQIAVKRLSIASGQGLQEFMNEVVVISKLQHRNLVRLLGCCIEAKEKMLIYEFMPNKSLDAFLFDPAKRHMLDWQKRFNIIQGICWGLLYLHRDSRLRIIHRDLKPSNILLDEELNPKISDFGMARIFGGKEDQENTKRIVGTYGYMAPEYAMEGKFSSKSDVFSFGVLLLEIVSGRKNIRFSDGGHSLNLLGQAWELWNENKVESLIDPVIVNTCILEEIMKCIRVGLLCVQVLAKDRPSISKVLYYLSSEIADIPSPKPPGFILRQRHTSSSGEGSSSQLPQQQQSRSYSVYEDETILIAR